MTAHVQRSATEVRAGVNKRLKQVGVMLVGVAVLLFAPAGSLTWGWAWVLLGLYLAGSLLAGSLVLRIHPETIAARAETTGQRGWDRIVSGLWALAMVATLAVAGLDVRWGWSDRLALELHLIGAAGFAGGLGLFMWAMVSNAAFATVSRIGPADEHRVCSSGPYHWIRHPGYFGAIVQAFATPLLLGSLWAFVPGVAAGLAMLARTALEDAMLRVELPGYALYSEHVRFRLVPGVW
ncbi:MAG: hypothetical protein JNL73_21625 [Anaerolineales bacterium]|nr:hypothetical protein [Anaerolineales bacterium]